MISLDPAKVDWRILLSEWQKTTLQAVIAELRDAGLSNIAIAEEVLVDERNVRFWYAGRSKPGVDSALRLMALRDELRCMVARGVTRDEIKALAARGGVSA